MLLHSNLETRADQETAAQACLDLRGKSRWVVTGTPMLNSVTGMYLYSLAIASGEIWLTLPRAFSIHEVPRSSWMQFSSAVQVYILL